MHSRLLQKTYEHIFLFLHGGDGWYSHSPKPESHDCVTSNNVFFLDLPADIRNMVYGFSFSDAKVLVNWSAKETNKEFRVSRGPEFPNQILQTCKFIWQEAMPILEQSLCLQVRPNQYRKHGLVTLDLSLDWQARIQTIEYSCPPRLRFDPASFVNLRMIVLEHKIYSVGSFWSLAHYEVKDLAMEQIQKKDQYLIDKTDFCLQYGDQIKVRMDVWLMNTRSKASCGWEVCLDARNWECLSIEKVLFGQRHCYSTARTARYDRAAG